MNQQEIKVKIFTAVVDPNVDTYLEKEIEKWRIGTPTNRIIQSIYPALSMKEIVVFVTYHEHQQTQINIKENFEYLLKNGKKIFSRNLEYDDYKEMGFPEELL